MTHTPGPWEYDGKFRVGIPHKDGWTGFRTNPEDARLIAAAPLLLKCLEDMVAASNHSAAWERARAAIAQAKGENK